MKRNFLAALLPLLLLTLTACGGGSRQTGGINLNSGKTEESATMDMAEPESPMEYGGGVTYSTATSTGATVQKLIRTADLQMETTEFDTALTGLNDLTEQYEGYYENSTVRKRSSGYRSAEYTIRVPSKHYQIFVNQAGELCHETWRNLTQEDVTERYYDTEGRLKTQKIKLERLQQLLSQAKLMEDIITIETAISQTEWQIEELSGTLRHYDTQVDYATVHITLSEVYKLSNVENTPESFGERMSIAFAGGLRSFSNNLENLAVSFAYTWMWWLLVAVVFVVVVRLVRGQNLRRKKRQQDDKQENS
jgi:hypothetical protein